MTARRNAVRFGVVALATAAALLAGVAGFNALVDPFRMYRWVEVDGVNVAKPAIYRRVRLLKVFEVRRTGPGAVILGSSRSHLGLRPTHEGWDRTALPAYNLAFDGATTREMYHYLVHAHTIRPLRQVVLGLDTYHPTLAPGTTRPDFDPLLLESPDVPSLLRLATADLRLLISLDTLRASIQTLGGQREAEPEWLAPDGQRLGESFFYRPAETFVREGQRAYFEEIDRLEVGYKLEGTRPPSRRARPAPPVPPVPVAETSLGYIRRIAAFCRDQAIDLRLFLTPAHARQLEISAATGEWPSIESAKRALVRVLAEDAASHPDRAPFPLYDFSGYSSVTTERLPNPGEEMRYYWDSSHFKEEVGDWVLDRLFGVERADHPVPADFGVRLTAENVEEVLALARRDQVAYRERHPADVETVRRYVADWRRENLGAPDVARAP